MERANNQVGMVGGYGHKNCCGCTACIDVCPKHCLEMIADSQGFLYPVMVNEKTCVDCGLCSKICPTLHPFEKKPLLGTFAAYSDEINRMKCSSGGVGSLLAEAVIKRGGIVFGARFDSQWNVIIDSTDKLEELYLFAGSKYVQAESEGIYARVLSFLKEGKTVLFTGLPCQVSGLLHFLRHDYENLITVGCICHSVPSPKVWHKFLYENCNEGEIHRFSFRDKTFGWKNYTFKVEYKNGNERFLSKKSVYMRAMLEDLSTRPACSVCKMKDGKSHSDIELGDCWGAENICPDMYDDKGLNVLQVYSEKGRKLIDALPIHIKQIDVKEVLKYNQGLKEATNPHPRQKLFFILLRYFTMETVLSLCVSVSKKSFLKKMFQLKLSVKK